jgi:SLOG cluster4 family
VFDREAAEVAARLPAGPRLAVIGSTSFWHAESAETCAILGRSLAALDGLVLVTGGVEGVGEAVARSFWAARGGLEGGPRVFHILPRGHARRDHGETLTVHAIHFVRCPVWFARYRYRGEAAAADADDLFYVGISAVDEAPITAAHPSKLRAGAAKLRKLFRFEG